MGAGGKHVAGKLAFAIAMAASPLFASNVWINEIHYDNANTDAGESIEVAGPAGTDLSGFQLVLYNGANSQTYGLSALSGVIDNEGCGFGAIAFAYAVNGIQNGGTAEADAIALVEGTNVLQFLSYEGVITAVNGPATGMTSVDIGVSEGGTTPVGYSLQLEGAGATYAEFTWMAPTTASAGSLNAGQIITTCGGPTNLPVLSAIGNRFAALNGSLSFGVAATDPDGDAITLTVSNAPAGSTFGSTNGSGTFAWSAVSPAGVYTTSFYAADNDGADFETVIITVAAQAAAVSFHAAEADVEEGTRTQLVAVAINVAVDASFHIAASGTATPGLSQDYQIASSNIVFTSGGPTQQFVQVVLRDDSLSEGPETIVLTITNLAGATTGSITRTRIFMRDDDAFTLMAANLSSQSDACNSLYGDAGGRFFRGLKPDIVAIQEFNVTNAGGRRAFVDANFGTNFHYYVEPQTGCALPNGIISRWPIVATGQWDNVNTSGRDFAWASIRMPGVSTLHVVSVHFKAGDLTSEVDTRIQEARDLTNYIRQANFPTSDYFAICGDLNQPNRSELTLAILTNIVSDANKPADQFGDRDTNVPRSRPYDYVLPGFRLQQLHLNNLNVEGLVFANGLVFDSRLWTTPPAPIQTNDSESVGLQHEPVMKLFALADKPPTLQPIGDRLVASGASLVFPVEGTATDGDAVTLTASNLPPGATFGSTNAIGTFVWTNASPAGVYTSRFFASDNDGMESEDVRITVFEGGALWVNEVHYNNASIDTNEGVEIAGVAGLDLSACSLSAYSASDGSVYSTTNLSGLLDDEGCGYGAVWFDMPGLQNNLTGIALMQGTSLVQFISYGGVVTASNGPATGLVSQDIGRTETDSTPVGRSLQLHGYGTNAVDFVWTGPTNDATPGTLNAPGQVLSTCGPAQQIPVLAAPGSFSVSNGATVIFQVIATDTNDNDVVTLSALDLPPGAMFGAVSNATAVTNLFTWSAASPVGVYTTTFVAADNDGTTNVAVTITVEPDLFDLWVNEVHYSNTGADTNEGVEIAGPAGADVAGFTIHAYNGSVGTVYLTTNLSGVFPDEGCGFGTLWFAVPGLQNDVDGIALARNTNVIQFLSYEGVFTASNGPALNQVSVNIGTESDTLAIGRSLQLQGAGSNYAAFAWAGTSNNATPGTVNLPGQSIGCAANPDTDGDGIPDAWESQYFVDLNVAGSNSDFDTDGFVDRDEYRAGTIPTNDASLLDIASVQPFADGVVIVWQSASNRVYALGHAEKPDGPYAFIETNLPATVPYNAYTNPGATNAVNFFRIELR